MNETLQGWINLYKPKNISSFFAIKKIQSKFQIKKIGQEYIQKMKKTSNNAERYTDKLPKNFLSIGFIRLILPHAKIIHCFRNSKDNCLSLFKNHFPGGKINFAYDFTEIVNYYIIRSAVIKLIFFNIKAI